MAPQSCMSETNETPVDRFIKYVLQTYGACTVHHLQDYMGYDDSTIRRHLNNLVENGPVVKIKQSDSQGGDLPSVYRLPSNMNDPINRFIRYILRYKGPCNVHDLQIETGYSLPTIRYHLDDMRREKRVMVKLQYDENGSDLPSLYRLAKH